MIRIKMVGFDLDGTLLTSDKRITKRTKEAVERAVRQGAVALPATGRPLSGIPKEVLELPGIRYALTANGARIVDVAEGKILHEELVSYETGGKVLDIFLKYDAIVEVYYDGQGYADGEKLAHIERYLPGSPMAKYVTDTRKPVADVRAFYDGQRRPTDKVQAVFATLDDRETAIEEIKSALSGEVEITGALLNNIEVNARGVNKGKGLLMLGELLGIKREEIMACGDGANDLEMLKMAGLGVAMENALDDVKEAGDVLTASNDEDGVAKAIEKYVLD